jgi:hypothetical protein
MEMKSVAIIYDYELDKMVSETWPEKAGFESQADFELTPGCDYLCQDIMPEMTSDFVEWLNDDHVFGPSKHEVLKGLCCRGVIAAGNYLLRA